MIRNIRASATHRAPRRHTASVLCYRSPSSITSQSALEQLKSVSAIVPDSIPTTSFSDIKSSAALVTCGFLSSILASEPLGLQHYSTGILAARAATRGREEKEVISLALVNVGALLAAEVEGRVLTEVNSALAYDEAAMVAEVELLSTLYIRANVPANNVLFRLPATWEGLSAASKLEKKGIATQVHLVSSLVQAVAAAQAKVSVVQISLGRVREFYQMNPGVVKDSKGPRQDAGSLTSQEDPGIDLIRSIYGYFNQHHPDQKPKIFISGIRKGSDALAVSGADFILIPPRILTALDSEATTAGYNDGLHLNHQFEPSLRLEASPQVPLMPQLTSSSFDLPMISSSLLKQALQHESEERQALVNRISRFTTSSSQL